MQPQTATETKTQPVLICNLRSQFLRRDYVLLNLDEVDAWVELRNPSTCESTAAFLVPSSEVIDIRPACGEEISREALDFLVAARTWVETVDAERV